MVALIGAGCSNASSENGSSGGNKNATNSSSTFFWLVYWLEGERALPSG
jgi:hypothetical protein